MSDSNNQEIVIIDLFNQALSSGNDRIRLQHLRHIQELIIRKHPDLLERFIQDILNFQTNKSPEIKKLIISFIDEAWLVKIMIRFIIKLFYF
jgi:symplekin